MKLPRTAFACLAALALAPAARSGEADPYKYIITYTIGSGASREPLTTIESELRTATPKQLLALEGKLLAALDAPKATYGGKQFACRMLRRIGTARSVPSLARLLTDKKLSHMARFALQGIGGAEAGSALRAALDKTSGDLQAGVVGTLGRRRDAEAIPAIAKLLGSADENIAHAAVIALGDIGTREATDALIAALPKSKLKALTADALLRAADRLLATDATRATAIYRDLAAEGPPTMVRLAAFRGIARAEGGKAVPTLLALLKSPNPTLQRAVGGLIAELPGEGVTRKLAAQLPALPPGAQVVILSALAGRGDKAGASAVAKVAESKNESVRLAAIDALAAIGGAGDVPLLAKLAVGASEDAATQALTRLTGDGVAAAIARLLKSPDAAVRAKAIEVATARKEPESLPAAMTAASDADAKVRTAAFKALADLATEKELPQLVALLVKCASSSERRALGQTVGAVAARVKVSKPVIDALGKADDKVKPDVLAILARLGGKEAFVAVRGQLKSADAEVKKAAVRALADWPSATPLSELMAVAKSDTSPANRILAQRGVVRLVQMDTKVSAPAATAMLADVLRMAARPDEKRAVLSALPAFACKEALELAQSQLKAAGLEAEAKQAVSAIQGNLIQGAMKVSASSKSKTGAPKNAIDRNKKTRWDTGGPQKPGQWFAIDLGRSAMVKSVTLDHIGSANDFPRGYEAYVSHDGKSWGKALVTGKGAEREPTRIVFPEPRRARHIKIVQTGSATKWYWSIHELTVELD